jgi:cell wall-associated NlpC family hydrolase
MRFEIFFLCVFCLLSLSSCGLFRKTESNSKVYTSAKINQVIREARSHIGTPYKFGGTNPSVGLDCSGLVNLAFAAAQFDLPRQSADIALLGREIKTKEIRVGDLVFFITNNGTRINHVGIVTERKSSDSILFIHAATNGVKEDNLFSRYYQQTFVKATRPF